MDAGQEQQGLLLVRLTFVELNTHTHDVNRFIKACSLHFCILLSVWCVRVCKCMRERATANADTMTAIQRTRMAETDSIRMFVTEFINMNL